jgi:protease-4
MMHRNKEDAMRETPVFEPPVQQERTADKKTNTVVLWIMILLLAVCVAPAVGCGAFGFSVAMAGSQPVSTGVGPAVAVIQVSGAIMSGSSSTSLSGSVVGADTIVELIERAGDDSDVKALVLRVNSPGGGVVASDEIHHALTQVEKPIVVSMGEMAASGGYYISAPADYIFATPHTLTGSIGVISEFITAEELMAEVGISVEVVKSGSVKDFGSPYREMTREEREYWQALIDSTYEAFVTVVAEGRNMEVADVRKLADGRVYTGQEAIDLGLVDALGYYGDAVYKAGELGGIEGEPRVIEFEQIPSLLETLYGIQGQQNPPLSMDLLRELITPTFEFRYLGP